MLHDQNVLNVKKNGGGVGIGMGKITTTQALTTWSLQSNGRRRHIKSNKNKELKANIPYKSWCKIFIKVLTTEHRVAI